jgi:hypothetical protein
MDNIISFAAHATFFRRGDSRTLLLVWVHKESLVKQKKPLYKKSYDMSQIYINVRNIIVGFSSIFLVSGHSSLCRTKDLRKKEITSIIEKRISNIIRKKKFSHGNERFTFIVHTRLLRFCFSSDTCNVIWFLSNLCEKEHNFYGA